MPRLLIVSPHFPPVNAPDMQRVRMSLPHFLAAGWEVTVLAADDPEPLAPLEPDLLATIPEAVRVVRVPCLRRRWTGKLGLNNLGLRLLPYLYQAGSRVIREWRPDVVYFSTTQFITLPLGRLWQRRFGVPFVIDLQDPWLSDFYEQPGAPPPPGGWKYRIAHWTSARLEGWTLRKVGHVISVSDRYLETLRFRYPWFHKEQGTTLPFGAPEADMELARRRSQAGPPLLKRNGGVQIAYAGRLGMDMRPALEVLFAGIAACRRRGVEIGASFFGTSYAGVGRGESTTAALVGKFGVGDRVRELPDRIPYLDSLRLLLETDVALVLGSTDAAYSPSKIYPTLLAGKPILAIAPEGSVLEGMMAELGETCSLVRFGGKDGSSAASGEHVADCLCRLARREPVQPVAPRVQAVLERHSAQAVAHDQLAVFERVINPDRNSNAAQRASLVAET